MPISAAALSLGDDARVIHFVGNCGWSLIQLPRVKTKKYITLVARKKKRMGTHVLGFLSSSVSTATLATTTTASEGITPKSKLPSVPLMGQGTQSIIADASPHHYHYGDDMLPSHFVEAPYIGDSHSSLGKRCIIFDSRVFQPTKWQSILSSRGSTTTTTMARSGFAQKCQRIKSLSRVMTFKWPQSLSSQDRPSEQEGGLWST